MKGFFSRLLDKISGPEDEEMRETDDFEEQQHQEYVELDNVSKDKGQTKIIVRPYTIEDFSDIKGILDSLREGYTIALINIKPLKEKDIIELKRAVSKLKKTCDAIEGDIAGFDEDYIIVTPSFAKIHKAKLKKDPVEKKSDDFDY